MKNIIPPILVLFLFLFIWSIAAQVYNLPFMLPGPMAVAEAFINDFDIVLIGASITIQEALFGYLSAIAIGITVAAIMRYPCFSCFTSFQRG